MGHGISIPMPPPPYIAPITTPPPWTYPNEVWSTPIVISTPPATTPTIGTINNNITNFYNELTGNSETYFYLYSGQILGGTQEQNYIPEWSPPIFTPDRPNNCTQYNNELHNTNENCLRALINNCNIGIENQNNVTDYNNCSNLLGYAKTIVNSSATAINTWITNTSGWLPWRNGGACNFWEIVPAPQSTVCTKFQWAQTDCPLGQGRIEIESKRHCEAIMALEALQIKINPIESSLNYTTCPLANTISTSPINCCNNTLNCEFAECINIIQSCQQTINGESEISNATDCTETHCTFNGQKCLAGTPGAGNFNWLCVNNEWTKPPPPSPPPPPPPPPPASTPPTPPASTPTPPTTPTPPASTPTPSTPPTTPPVSTPTPTPSTPTPPTTPTPVPSEPPTITQLLPSMLSSNPNTSSFKYFKPKKSLSMAKTNNNNYTMYIIFGIISIIFIFILYFFM